MTDVPLFDLKRLPARTEVDNIIALLTNDPRHATDRRIIVTAIVAEARGNHGKVDPNGLRARLTGPDRRLTIYPRVLPAVIGALVRLHILIPAGRVRSSDVVGKNTNKTLPVYKLRQTITAGAA